MGTVELGRGAEFDLIRGVLGASGGDGPSEGIVKGPGDDAAVVRAPDGERLVISTDMAVEEVHFRRAWLRWRAVGRRATGAALSDLAAMAAAPLGVLLSAALPPELDRDVLEEVGRGLGDCLSEHGGVLLGGDLTRSPGPVVLDLVAVGSARAPVGRDGARAGEEVWVTGELGAAATAAADWLQGLEPDRRARRAFEHPRPRIGEARWLAERIDVGAMIDLSDGLAGDAGHLSAASGVRIEVELDRVPLAEVLEEYSDRTAALRRALGGGEDYELCFTAPAGTVGEVASGFRRRFRISLTRVGRVTEGRGVAWRDAAGNAVDPGVGGFDHFRRGAPGGR